MKTVDISSGITVYFLHPLLVTGKLTNVLARTGRPSTVNKCYDVFI